MKLLRDLQAYHSYVLGIAHYRGLFRPVDPVEAANCFTKSASLGLAAAQNQIGLMYIEGYGVPRHYREAFRWFRESAESNDAEGNCFLGLMYAHGHGTIQSWEQAEQFWLKAAVGGNAESMYFLGMLHYAGIQRPVCIAEAAAWFEKSALTGYAPAAHALGSMHRSGEHPSANENDAIKWFRLAAEKDYGPSLSALGAIYQGPGEHHNTEQAAASFKRAASSGDSDAMYRIGMMYLDREDGENPFSDFLALGWLKKAVEENHPGAAYVLGCMYEGGEGIFFEPEGKSLALQCFRKSAMLGDSRAETKLKWIDQQPHPDKDAKELSSLAPRSVRPAILKWLHLSREQKELEQLLESAKKFYASEEGKKDPSRAAEYFRLCSAAGSAEAEFMLGQMYERGEGVDADHALARQHYQSALQRGFEEAKAHLQKLS
ncbi:MAG: SEL1-like repeat protein [Candidatus Obscuribacterales bacterium]|nr:SEL1-like repeat protein [Candidatus Obscuribacterales bacterium]